MTITKTSIYKQINNYLSKSNSQLLITSTDKFLLNNILKEYINVRLSNYIEITDNKTINQIKGNPTYKYYILYLDYFNVSKFITNLYYLIELPQNNNCHLILVTTNCQVLNLFEKRIRSRFENNIIFIKTKSNSKSDEITNFINKYDLKEYSVSFILELLEPIHLFMIYLVNKYNISKKSIISKFKEYSIQEFKSVSSIKILYSYYDLIEFKVISESGSILIDLTEYKNFIRSSSKLYYLKKIIF
ncbi:hypothetical protein HERIO_802 [Hepatospora eriocheir]|uniref:Uncharacterized protein n=1 Tax=Hepatospora eriocheir TaxID=1081669 RepID=A0A1X0QC27_9MICR|nr:hypothetical protein HERIO_802 [Hepatospora eriocheir]